MIHHGQPIKRLLERLKGVKKTPSGWDALCPAHDDTRPSLGVKVCDDGKLVLNCRSHQCTKESIVKAVGLTMADLFPPKEHERSGAKKIVAEYSYLNEEGRLLFQAVRFDPKDFRQRRRDPDKNGSWLWNLQGVRRVPYNLLKLTADKLGVVFICEGEKDCDALNKLGLLATCNAGGAGKFGTIDAETIRTTFSDRHIIILPDNDAPGHGHGEDVARRLNGIAKAIKVVNLPGLLDKGDVSDWLASGGTRDRLLDICDKAPNWEPHAEEEHEETKAHEEPKAEEKPQIGFVWSPISSAEFIEADYRPNWLVKNVVVERQPLIIGGPQKVLKTSVAIDLGLSVATATPALGVFDVPHARRVAILSGESGPFALQSIARRVADAKGIDLGSVGDMLSWQFRLPQLAMIDQLDMLHAGLVRDKVEVAVFDPLYLSLLSGSDARAENLFDMGPLLMRVAHVCDDAGTSPFLLHHAPKPVSRKTEPMDLTDLAFAGIAEFARQWLLISRREPYQHGSGQHALWFVVGGSVGHNGLYAVDIDEGKLESDFSGRRWEVTVTSGTDAKRVELDEKADKRRTKQAEKDAEDDRRLLEQIDKAAKGEKPIGKTTIRDKAGLDGPRLNRAMDRLADAIEEFDIEITMPKGGTRKGGTSLRRKTRSGCPDVRGKLPFQDSPRMSDVCGEEPLCKRVLLSPDITSNYPDSQEKNSPDMDIGGPTAEPSLNGTGAD